MVNGLTLVSIFCLTKFCFYIYIFAVCISDPWGTSDLGEMSVKCWCEGTTDDQSRIVVLYVCMRVRGVCGCAKKDLILIENLPMEHAKCRPVCGEIKTMGAEAGFFREIQYRKAWWKPQQNEFL